MVLQEQSLQILQQVIDQVDVGVCLDVCLGSSRVGNSGLLRAILSGEGWSQLFLMQSQLSYEEDRPVFQCQGPASGIYIGFGSSQSLEH